MAGVNGVPVKGIGIRQQLQAVGIGKISAAAFLIWIFLLILTPISIWIAGDQSFPLMATLGVLAQGLTTMIVVFTGVPRRGWVLRTVVLVLAFTWAVEFIGSTTGLPFGNYTYTPLLQPQLGHVPLLIPLAWLMMLFPVWAVTESILEKNRRSWGRWYPYAFAVVSGLAMAVWDLYLDPQMVSRDLWRWEGGGGYFGIPWMNFFGWWLSTAVLTLLARPVRLPKVPLVAIYSLTWAFQAVGLGLFWGQPGPALAGLVGMGVFVWLAWSRLWPK